MSHIPRSISNPSKSFATFSAAAHRLASSSKRPLVARANSPAVFQCPHFASVPSVPSALVPRSPDSRRSFTSSPRSSKPVESESKPSWDHVFADLDENAAILPQHSRTRPGAQAPYSGRRHTMTAREIRAFDEMFDMIFDSASKSSKTAGSSTEDIGIGKGGVNDLFGKLRRNSRRMKWTTEADHELDRKKEAIDLCDTDQQLLVWAMDEVFAESVRYETAAREALMAASETGVTQELPGLQPPAYSQTIGLLMRTFREKYRDPHLALSIFDHAKHLSIASYVFGCSTIAYNELLETRWSCFRDLKGVHDALQEMKVNAVAVNDRTRRIVENLRHEIGEEKLWVDDNEAGSSEVWSLLAKIDGLVVMHKDQRPSKPKKWEDWRARSVSENDGEDWVFGNWSSPTKAQERALSWA